MANILILGGGFGGLVAAEELSRRLGGEHRITLVSTNEKFIFYPALVELALGECEPPDITFDLAARLHELDIRFVRGEVVKIIPEYRRVRVAGADFNGEIAYDFLVIAMGRRLATEKVKGFFEHADHILSVEAALDFGEKLRTFRRGTIVVGMAPRAFLPVPVCETAFALAERFKAGIETGEIALRVVFPETIAQAFGGADLTAELTAAFEKHGIGLVTEFPVKDVSAGEMTTWDGQTMAFDLLMLLPPFRGQSFLNSLGLSGEFDFIITDECLRVPHLQGVYAVGDIVDFPGPKLAFMAVRQAKTAAANIAAEIRGEEPADYYYHELATVIDAGGADSIYLHYGIWDEQEYRLKKGRFWGYVKKFHDKLWRAVHQP